MLVISNVLFQCSLCHDFDNNKALDAIPTVFLKDQYGKKREFTAHVRDDVVDQMPFLKKNSLTYQVFANTDIHQLFPGDGLKGALKLTANNFNSVYLRNDGKAHFKWEPLPAEAQLSSLFGMLAEDINGDGNLDVIINGNDYGIEVSTGRYDALNGLVLVGDGNGNFHPLTILQSGFFVPGNGKSIVKLCNNKQQCLVIASQNRGALKVYSLKSFVATLTVQPTDEYALIQLKNGKTRKQEFNYGSSFLSQPGRFLNIDGNIASVTIYDSKGGTRRIDF